MRFNIIICEDNSLQREILKTSVENIFKNLNLDYKLFEFTSGEDLLSNYPSKVDILFLDIQMGKLTGMDTAKEIRNFDKAVEIIFTTALIDYVYEGYEVKAYRYLLKPINQDELKSNVESCISDIIEKQGNFIVIENKGIIYKVLIDSIKYIEVYKKNLSIHTTNGIYHTRRSMDNIEKELRKYRFFRCHKSYLINMNYIKIINNNTVIISNTEIPVSKHRISNLKTEFTYMLGDILC